MRYDLEIQPELFEYEARPGEWEAGVGEWESELGDREAAFGELESGFGELEEFSAEAPFAFEEEQSGLSGMRWVQDALNRVLGLQLTVDGVVGPATRSAIRTFQQRQGLAVDGVVGPATEAALRAALAGGGGGRPPHDACDGLAFPTVLDSFEFDRDRTRPNHAQLIERIAQCIVVTQPTRQPVRRVRIIGHTDKVGDDQYNVGLGQRRAEAVQRDLRAAIERISPGLSARLDFTVGSRGELDAIPTNAPASRKVEVFVEIPKVPPPPPPPPPPRRGCPPFKSRLRVHFKILPGFRPLRTTINTMLENMKRIYGAAGILVELASTEQLPTAPNLDGNDAIDVGECVRGGVSTEQQQLFGNRNNVRINEVVAYFVRQTSPDVLNGCAAHPNGRPGAVITEIASQWTLAHEIGHVLGLNHVSSEPCDDPAFVPTRLMTGCGTGLLRTIPTLIQSESAIMDRSQLTVDC
jgi:outer membrane protein OmpA-like peptidoglycan-associated protein